MLIINSSISLAESNDLDETISKVVSQNIVCSTISLSAEINILSKLSSSSKGDYSVVLDTKHLESMVEKFIVPQVCHQELKG